MSDFFEIDFLNVEAQKSGDAIGIRYQLNGRTTLHVVDGGYQDTGALMVDHIQRYYGNPRFLDHVVATHPDGDHAGGLRTVLESFQVGALWMFRPWQYAGLLLPQFHNYASTDRLARRLKEIYSNLAALEDIATARGIPIYEPHQGQIIGAFRVLAPSLPRFLNLVVSSERTPESTVHANQGSLSALSERLGDALAKLRTLVKGLWGHEIFSPEGASAENEMSVVQFARLCGQRILLTGDAGREALTEAADFAPVAGLQLRGIDRFQVPHHGSRRNVSTEILDRWLGPRFQTPLTPMKFEAYNSSAKADEDHPRKCVVRAIHHRGGRLYDTKHGSIRAHAGPAPFRGWGAAIASEYPAEQET